MIGDVLNDVQIHNSLNFGRSKKSGFAHFVNKRLWLDAFELGKILRNVFYTQFCVG